MKKLFLFLLAACLAVPCNATIISGLYDIETSSGALDADLGGLPLFDQMFTTGNTEEFIGTNLLAEVNFNVTGSLLTLNVNVVSMLPLGQTITLTLHSLDLGGDVVTGVSEVSSLGATIDDSNLPGNEFSVTTSQPISGMNSFLFEIADSSSTPVPEPSSCALFLVGGLAAWRIRRKRAA